MRLRRKKKQDKNKLKSKSEENLTTAAVTEAGQTTSSQSDSQLKDLDTSGNVSANGGLKTGSLNSGCKTPPVERKTSKLAAFSRIFKPWKWKRRKKPSEKIEKTAVDLERKISVRTSREELIKRGVLKEVPEDQLPQPSTTLSTSGEEEAVQDDKVDPNQIQANGTPNTADSVHLRDSGGGGDPSGRVQADPPEGETIMVTQNNGIITTQADIAHGPHSPSIVSASHVHVTVGGESGRADSPRVDPKLTRVMLPVEDKDRHIPVVQKIPVIPHSTEMSTPPHKYLPAYTSASDSIHTPSGLTFATPQPHSSAGTTTFSTPSEGGVGSMYEEVPAHEPDLNKKPTRSALKGAKRQMELQQQLTLQLQRKHQEMNRSRTLPRGTPPKIAPKPNVKIMGSTVRVVDPSNKENLPVDTYEDPDYDNLHSDSDDEEIHYYDREVALAAKVKRQDSLARFLSQRPNRKELVERNIIPDRPESERQRDRDVIGARLTRRLSLRPTQEELEEKNILHRQTLEEMRREKEEKKKTLIRKLSFRPTVEELRGRKIINFNDYVEVTDAEAYDRRADKPWTRLTPKDKAAIRKELNEFKSTEMQVHEDSRHLTRFHRP